MKESEHPKHVDERYTNQDALRVRREYDFLRSLESISPDRQRLKLWHEAHHDLIQRTIDQVRGKQPEISNANNAGIDAQTWMI